MTAPAYFRLGGFVMADPDDMADPEARAAIAAELAEDDQPTNRGEVIR